MVLLEESKLRVEKPRGLRIVSAIQHWPVLGHAGEVARPG